MKTNQGTTFGPEELRALQTAFDEATKRLQLAGHHLGGIDASDAASLVLEFAAKGLSGEELIQSVMTARTETLSSGVTSP